MIRLTLAIVSLFLVIGRNDGRGIDPNGGLAGQAAIRATTDPDRGAGLDPNGRRAATANGDKGMGLDPNG